jgi:hypothetical protein
MKGKKIKRKEKKKNQILSNLKNERKKKLINILFLFFIKLKYSFNALFNKKKEKKEII